MNKVYMVSRYLLGLIFLIFGVNGLMMFTSGSGFIPLPPPSEAMQAVFAGFMATKYLMPVVKIIEVIAGILLLSNKMVNLAIVLLGPVVFNILFLHLFVDLSGLPIAAIVTILWSILIFKRCDDFKTLFCKC